MRGITKKCCLAMFLIAGFTAFAQNKTGKSSPVDLTVTLTIDDAVKYALEHSSTLKSNDIDLDMKRRAKNNSWNVFLPDVSAMATVGRSYKVYKQTMTGVVPDYDANEEAHWSQQGNIVASISASLNLSLAYISTISAAYKQYELQEISWEKVQNETIVNVRKLFYGLLLQKKSLEIQHTSLENLKNRYIQADANYKNGVIPEIQLLQAQVAYQNKKPEVEQLERTYKQQLDMFAFVIGFPMDSNLDITGEIEPTFVDVDGDVLIERYSSQSIDSKTLDKNLEILKSNLNAINFQSYTPALSLSYGLQPVHLGNASDMFSDIGSEKWMENGKLSFTLAWNLTNMLPWSKNRQNAQDLRDNIKKLEIQKQQLSENQKMNVRKNIDTLTQSKEQIEAMRRNVTVAQRSYDMTVRSYRSGTTEYLALKDAQAQLDQAKLALENQKFNYISALLDLENTLSINLVDSYTKNTEETN